MNTAHLRLHGPFHLVDAMRAALSRGLEGLAAAIGHTRGKTAVQARAAAIDVQALRTRSYAELLNYLEGGKSSSSGELRQQILAVEEAQASVQAGRG